MGYLLITFNLLSLINCKLFNTIILVLELCSLLTKLFGTERTLKTLFGFGWYELRKMLLFMHRVSKFDATYLTCAKILHLNSTGTLLAVVAVIW